MKGGDGRSAALCLQLLAAATFAEAAFCVVKMRRSSSASWEFSPGRMILQLMVVL